MISEELLDIICCPKTKQPLHELDGRLITADNKIAYPIKNDIPVLLAEEAINLDD